MSMTYVFNVLLFNGLFWGLYRLLLKRETFFTANRIYLLLLPVVCLLLPLISFDFLNLTRPEEELGWLSVNLFNEQLPAVYLTTDSFSKTGRGWSFSVIVGVIYLLGVGGSLRRLGLNLYQLYRLKKKGRRLVIEGQKIILFPDLDTGFSFWDTIFLGEAVKEIDKPEVIRHEKIHIAQKHTFDLLVYEVLKVILWFNPFLYWGQKDLAEIHEFMVDWEITLAHSKNNYVERLLKVEFGTDRFSFVNSFFNKQTLKNRIMMLHKPKSSRSTVWKYVLIFPLVCMMLTYVSCSKGQQETSSQSFKKRLRQKLAHHEISRDTLFKIIREELEPSSPASFGEITQPPQFKNSPDFQNKQESTAYFENRLKKFVVKQFNVEKFLKDSSLHGKVAIYVNFVVNEEGRITDIKCRAPRKDLKAEAIRIVKKLPGLLPGKEHGKPVSVRYTLPIIFKAGDKEG